MANTIVGWLRGSEFIPLPEMKRDGDIPVFTIDNIETKAERKAKKFLRIFLEEGLAGEPYDEIDLNEALSHIRALLAERRSK